VADIPDIFCTILKKSLQTAGVAPSKVLPLIGGDHFEAMCLDGFEVDNVRGVLDIADRLVSKLTTGILANKAIDQVFADRFGGNPVVLRTSGALRMASDMPLSQASNTVKSEATGSANTSHYEAYREQISAAFKQCNGNLSAAERLLKSQGIRATRRWIGIFATKWGLR
jgi:hypothetical protein